MSPGFAGVGGSVNAIAYRKIRPMQPLAATYINDVRVGRSNCDGADGLGGFVIEKGIPGAGHSRQISKRRRSPGPDIKQVGLTRDPRGSAGATAAKRPNHAPMQILISVFRNLRPTCRSSQKNDETHQ